MNNNMYDLMVKLTKNGFSIDKNHFNDFMKTVQNSNFADLVERLELLKRRINSPIDISAFAQNFLTGLNKLEEEVNALNISNGIQEKVQNLKDKMSFVSDYLAAQNALDQAKNEYVKVQYDLSHINEKGLSDEDLTIEFGKLADESQAKEEALYKAMNLFNEKKTEYDKALVTFDLLQFKNSLTTELDTLSTAIAALTNETLSSMFNEIKNIVDNFEIQRINSQKELDAICKYYHIVQKSKEPKISEKQENVETKTKEEKPINDFFASDSPILLPENAETLKESDAKRKKDNIAWLLYELERLNPRSNFELGIPSDSKYDALISCDNPLSSLYLPNGYYYTSTSITNKFSADEDILNVEFKTLDRTKDANIESIIPTSSELPKEDVESLDQEAHITTPEEALPEISNFEKELEEIKKMINYDGIATEEPAKEPEVKPADEEKEVSAKEAKSEDDMIAEISRNTSKRIEEEDQELFDKKQAEVPKTEGSIPTKKEIEVKRTRRAISAPMAKLILGVTATCTIASSLPLIVGIPIAALGSTISSIYYQHIKSNDIASSLLESEEQPRDGQGILNWGKELLKSYKKKLANNNKLEAQPSVGRGGR